MQPCRVIIFHHVSILTPWVFKAGAQANTKYEQLSLYMECCTVTNTLLLLKPQTPKTYTIYIWKHGVRCMCLDNECEN